MKVWKINAPNSLECITVQDFNVPEGYAKVKLSRTALSQSDVRLFRGTEQGANYPVIPARQGVGIVGEVAEGESVKRGDRVVIQSHTACGECYFCKNNAENQCEKMRVLGIHSDGMLRDFAIVPVSNLYELPAHVKDNEAVFIEHIALAVKALTDLGLSKGEHIVIIGATITGLLLAQVAMYYQAVPIVIDNHQSRLDVAASLGIYYTINASTTDPHAHIVQYTGGRYAECVAYIESSHDKIGRAFDYAANGGRAAIIGWYGGSELLSGDCSKILAKQLKVVGVSNGCGQIPSAINLLAKKAVDVAPLVTKEVSFDDVPAALQDYANNSYQYFKVIVKF